MSSLATGTIYTYIGTFTRMPPHPRGRAEGIYVFRFDLAAGTLEHVHTVPGVDNPSYLALDAQQRHLYAVNAVPAHDGQPGGAVSAFAIDQATGNLTLLNRQATHGAGPAYVSVAPSGRFVLAANYGGGSVVAFPVEAGGRLGAASAVDQHQGAGPNPQRQEAPHAHSIRPDPSGRFILSCDLGLDRVFVYRLDDDGRLLPNDPPWFETHPGAGPRHFDFHPSGRFVYVINELDSTITACTYDSERGVLTEIHHVSTLPPGWQGANTCADIHVAPSGRFVYGSNRGHDSLAIFAIDEASGRLSPAGHVPTQGQTPRNFAFDPSGAFLLAANQDSDTIVTFRVDAASGQLTPTGAVTQAPSPVCIVFAPQVGR